MKGGTYSVIPTPNNIFEELFMAIIFNLKIFVRILLRMNRQEKYFSNHVLFKISADNLITGPFVLYVIKLPLRLRQPLKAFNL